MYVSKQKVLRVRTILMGKLWILTASSSGFC